MYRSHPIEVTGGRDERSPAASPTKHADSVAPWKLNERENGARMAERSGDKEPIDEDSIGPAPVSADLPKDDGPYY